MALGYPPLVRHITVVILNGQSLSAAFDLGGNTLLAVRVPAGFLGSVLTFQTSDDQVTYDNLYDDGGFEVPATAAASRDVSLAAIKHDIAHIRFGKIRAGSAAAPTVQNQDITLTLHVRFAL